MYKCTRLWRRLGDIFAFPFFPLKFILVVISSSLNKSLVIVHRKFPAEHAVAQANCWTSLLMTNSQFPGTISFGDDVNDGGVCRAGYQYGVVCHCEVQGRGDGVFIQVGQSCWHGLVPRVLLNFFWLSGNRSVGVGTPWQFSLSNNWIALSGCLFCWVSWTTSFAGTDVGLGVWSCLRYSLRPLIHCGGVSISSRILFTSRLVSAWVLWMLFSFWQQWTSFTKGVHHTSILDLESFTFLAFSHADRSSCLSLKTSTDSVWDPQLDLFSSLLSTNCLRCLTGHLWGLLCSTVSWLALLLPFLFPLHLGREFSVIYHQPVKKKNVY